MQPMLGGDASKLALLKRQEDMLDMLSLRFSESKSYAEGDFALYFNGVFDGLYHFTKAKAPGVWDSTVVAQVSLTDVLKNQTASIATLNEQHDDLNTQLFPNIVYYQDAQSCIDGIYKWITNVPNGQIHCHYIQCGYSSQNAPVAGALYGGRFLIIGFRQDNYAGMTALSYWSARVISVATIENGNWGVRFKTVALS